MAPKPVIHQVEPETIYFSDDGETPNNPHFPLTIYRNAVDFGAAEPAAVFEALFATNGWTGAWRNGVYGFNHFHSAAHEVLGIAAGHVTIQFGGAKGRAIRLQAGDVVVQPAGTGHRRIEKSDDLLVVGAYPKGSAYDQPHVTKHAHDNALTSIAAVPVPDADPLFGPQGTLTRLWHSVRR